MATRINNPAIQHFDKGTRAPLAGGQMFFFETQSTTPKDVFDDVSETTVIANPVILDGNGFEPDIFGTGSYKIVLQNADDVQQWERDPVDFGTTGSTGFSDWLASVTYNSGDIVTGSDGNFYISIQDGNENNDPTIPASSTFWTQWDVLKRWNEDETYVEDDVVRSVDSGGIYTATTTTTGNDPDNDADVEFWEQFGDTSLRDNVLRTDGDPLTIINTEDEIFIEATESDITLTADGDVQIGDPEGTPIGGNVDLAATTGLRIQVSEGDMEIVGEQAITINANSVDNDGSVSISSRATASFISIIGNLNLVAADDDTLGINAAAVRITNGTGNSLIASQANITQQVFVATGAGTWNRPDDVKNVIIELLGAGGGGGGVGGGGVNSGAQGGGAGAYIRYELDVTATASINFSIGAGGTGGTGNNNGLSGGDTTINAITAGGGSGGAQGGTVPNTNGGLVSGAPLTSINTTGGDGGLGASTTTAETFSGFGGATYFGGGPHGVHSGNGGSTGAKGTGGSGAGDTGGGSDVGGTGNDGFITFTEFY